MNRADDALTIFKHEQATAPSILLTATLRWPIAARLAIAFAQLGCRVEAICPRQHPVTRVCAVRQFYPYAALKPLVSLGSAIKYSVPDFIIPCDDDAAIHLYQLYAQAGAEGASATVLRRLIARSLGSPEACALATAREELMALATEQGVLVPETLVVKTSHDVSTWCSRHGFPAVIKTDSSWGGQGVSIVHNHKEAQCAFAQLASPPTIVNAAARSLLERAPRFLWDSLQRVRRNVTIQNFILGAPANRAVACWQGKVLAGTSVEAIHTQHSTGPATVARVIDNPEMSVAAQRLVHRLGVSGLWGFDFILEASTGAAYLIEANPRATPICHLPLGAGRNLPAALYAQLTGMSPAVLPAMIDYDVIAMFPGEWNRNPASPYLHTGYQDIPWDETELIQDCIDRPWSERGLVARLWAYMHPKPATSPALRHIDASARRIRLPGEQSKNG